MISGAKIGSSLLTDAESWLYRAGVNRLLKPSDPQRTAQVILLERQAEELILRLVNFHRGYAESHEKLSKMVKKLQESATPGPNGDGHRHWSIAEEFPVGRSGDFRRALNELITFLNSDI